MYFFDRFPKARLIFCFFHLAFIICPIIEGQGLGVLVLSPVFIFLIYITLIKAGFIKRDERSERVDDFNLDFCNIIMLIVLIREMFPK